jgi:hypothetical protein
MKALSRADLAKFFRAFARQLPCPAKLILTGGSEALVLGGRRPTADIDFALLVSARRQEAWPAIEKALEAATRESRVVVQYSTDIDRWSAIAIPPKKIKTRRHLRIGRLTVRLLDPRCWAVYKLSRYLDSDVEDLLVVLRRERIPAPALARLCGECLRSSPRSSHLFLFRRQVEHFFREHGARVWGKGFESQRTIDAFRRAAKIEIGPRH